MGHFRDDRATPLSISRIRHALAIAGSSVRRLDPRVALGNPVLFAGETAALAATILYLGQIATGGGAEARFIAQVAGWLWFTVCYANLIEAIAEGRGITRTRARRADQEQTTAKRLCAGMPKDGPRAGDTGRTFERVPADALRPDAVVLVETGETIPADGEVIAGVAEVDESAITGELAPVIRESGGERSTVIGGTRVVSDWLEVRVTASAGDSFLDHIARVVNDTKRLRSSREGVVATALTGLALLATIACAALAGLSPASGDMAAAGMVVALFAALLPLATAANAAVARLGSVGRLLGANIVAKSAQAIEAAGRVATVLLDKTGTITFGNRQAHAFLTLPGVSETELAEAALLASLGDETGEGRSIVALAKRSLDKTNPPGRVSTPIPFSAHTRNERRPSGRRKRGLERGERCGPAEDRCSGNGRPAVDHPIDRPSGRYAAAGGERPVAARHHQARRHGQARPGQPLRSASPHRHPHGNGNRR